MRLKEATKNIPLNLACPTHSGQESEAVISAVPTSRSECENFKGSLRVVRRRRGCGGCGDWRKLLLLSSKHWGRKLETEQRKLQNSNFAHDSDSG
jgi:hypothetical protein